MVIQEVTSFEEWKAPSTRMLKVSTDAFVTSGMPLGLDAAIRDKWGELKLLGIRGINALWIVKGVVAATTLFKLQQALTRL